MKRKREAGATLVEFALVVPLLLLLLFGIIEMGWLFALNLDVKHGAREGARLAAVDELSGAGDICARMDVAAVPDTLVSANRTGTNIGDDIQVRVATPAQTLTGFLDWAVPAGALLESTVTIRVEQPLTWSVFTNEPCP